MKMICRMLIVSLFFFSFHVNAGMIGTDRVVAAAPQGERAQIESLMSRAEVAGQLEALGVDLNAAKARVAAMTDDEARSLAGKLGNLPAGADSEGWWIAAAVVVAVLLWWWWARR